MSMIDVTISVDSDLVEKYREARAKNGYEDCDLACLREELEALARTSLLVGIEKAFGGITIGGYARKAFWQLVREQASFFECQEEEKIAAAKEKKVIYQ